MVKRKETVSVSQAKLHVRYLAEEARVMTGALHPDDMDEARAYIKYARRVLNGIIDGRVQVKRRRGKR